ncbi:unnamed protein product, partial [Amoebophrya sp. A25]
NALIAGKRCLLRSSVVDAVSGKAKLKLERHCLVEGKAFVFPFDVSDDNVDVFIIMLHEKDSTTLNGVFIFPKEYLAERGILSVDRVGGKFSTMLYPPGCMESSQKEKKELASSQQSYFISFAKDSDCALVTGSRATEAKTEIADYVEKE